MEGVCPLCGRKMDNNGWKGRIPEDSVSIEKKLPGQL